jgi:hypothetical protein
MSKVKHLANRPGRSPVPQAATSDYPWGMKTSLSIAVLLSVTANACAEVKLICESTTAGGLSAYRIETPAATYVLEKSGAGLSSVIDREGRDWLSFRPEPGSGAGGEYRGFPNAVHQQAGNYFHAKNRATDIAFTKVEFVDSQRVTISAVAENRLWACRYDFYPSHCTFSMTRMPADRRYWVLYEGTPGGQYDDTDWWITSADSQPQPLTTRREGDIPAPEWIAFGDPSSTRVLYLLHHEDDAHADGYYPMNQQMTVFGFGRQRMNKYLDSVPQHFSIGFLETTEHATVHQAMVKLLRTTP